MIEEEALFEAIVTIRMAVLGKNAAHAKQRALSNASREEPESVSIRHVNDLLDIPSEFYDTLPWGSDDLTVMQIVQDQRA